MDADAENSACWAGVNAGAEEGEGEGEGEDTVAGAVVVVGDGVTSG